MHEGGLQRMKERTQFNPIFSSHTISFKDIEALALAEVRIGPVFFVLFLFGFVLLNIKQCQYVYAIVDGNMKARREHFLCLARVNRIRDDHFQPLVKQILVNVRRRRTE